MVEGAATMIEKNGKPQITGVYTFKPPTLIPEQEAIFMQAATRLCEQGVKVSSRLLAKETGMSLNRALVFLQQHHHKLPLVWRDKASTHQERLAHVARVCAEQEASGERITVKGLAKAAHVRNETVMEYLQTRRENQHAA